MTFILYAANADDLSSIVPTFLVMAVLVTFYGLSDLIGITLASLAFIVFYHEPFMNGPDTQVEGVQAEQDNDKTLVCPLVLFSLIKVFQMIPLLSRSDRWFVLSSS